MNRGRGGEWDTDPRVGGRAKRVRGREGQSQNCSSYLQRQTPFPVISPRDFYRRRKKRNCAGTRGCQCGVNMTTSPHNHNQCEVGGTGTGRRSEMASSRAVSICLYFLSKRSLIISGRLKIESKESRNQGYYNEREYRGLR